MRRSRVSTLVAIGLFALVAFAVRAASLDAQSLWRDEVDALRFATAPWADMLSNFTRPGWNGPLYFLLLRGWVALAGTSEYAMRFLSLAFGVLCVPLAFVLGRRLFDRQVGLLAALLALASPYLAWYAQEVKMYTWVTALALLAVYALRRALEGGGWRWWAVQIVATSLAFYSHILAALLVPVQVWMALAWWPLTRRRWLGALISLACLTVPYLPLAAWQAPMVLVERETGFPRYALGEMVEVLLNGWSAGILAWGRRWGAVLLGTLAAWGWIAPAFPSRQGEGRRVGTRTALVGWLAIPLLAVWLISLRQPLFTDRYLIWTAPAFYLLVARGLVSVRRWGGQALGAGVALLLLGAILVLSGANLWRQATIPIKSDFRAAAAYVAQRRAPDELIVFQIPYSRFTFDYYFPQEDYPWAEGLYTNHRVAGGAYLMSEDQAAYRMAELTAGHDVVWLVATEVPMWDDRGLVQAWLDANGECVDETHVALVDVYRYVMRDS